MLERKDLDVVMVMTPSGLHGKIGMEVAAAGKHVVTTKPIDVTLQNADALIAACKKAGVILAVDFDARYAADNRRVKEAIERGRFGKMIFGEARLKWFRSHEYFAASGGWRGTWAMDGGGSLMNQTVHWVDIMQWLMGPVESVIGQIGIFTHKIETEDLGVAMLRFKSGAYGALLGTTTHPVDLPARVEVHGELGAAILENHKVTTFAIKGEPPQTAPYVHSGPKNVVEDVILAITKSKTPEVPGEEGRKSIEIVISVYRSAQTGQPVRLPLSS
jgi:predicted dehydrogenase